MAITPTVPGRTVPRIVQLDVNAEHAQRQQPTREIGIHQDGEDLLLQGPLKWPDGFRP